MEVHEMVEQIKSKEDLITFISRLIEDLKEQPDEWENPTLERFLESMGAWLTDSNIVSEQPTWMTFAEILYAPKIYE